MNEESFLTVRELAKRLNVPGSWVYDQVRRRLDPLPHYKMGKYLRFRWSEVVAWIETHRRGGPERRGEVQLATANPLSLSKQ